MRSLATCRKGERFGRGAVEAASASDMEPQLYLGLPRNLTINHHLFPSQSTFSWKTTKRNPFHATTHQRRSFCIVRAHRVMPSDTFDGQRQRQEMVPTKELVRRGTSVNGSSYNNYVNRRQFAPLKRIFVKKEEEEEMVEVLGGGTFGWASNGYDAVQRSLDIWVFLVGLRLRVMLENEKWTYAGSFSKVKQSARRRRTASWLREETLRLGPTFIKFGQFFSTRSDLLPKEYVDELSKLQDKVPAFSPETARRLIERELGAPVSALFKQFEDRPIAAASLGQVHYATLHNGEEVVVKVQRPGLKRLFEIDLRNMKLLAEYFQNSENVGGPRRNWLAIYEDCSELLYLEIDYINEGKNADRLRRDFRNVKWVRVPIIYWDYTSRKVLTLEYVPGIKINDLALLSARGFNHSRIASSATEAYLMQILKTGFFHADPHPGNLAIDHDGSLVYYDFGMMGEIKPLTRERLLELFFAVYENDAKKVVRRLVALGVVQPSDDMLSVQHSVKFLLDRLANQKADRHENLAAIREELLGVAKEQPIFFPSTFIYVMKAFTTIEGIGYMLDPQFSFAKCAAPYIQDLVLMREKQLRGVHLVADISKQANKVGNYALSLPFKLQRIEDFTKQLESGDLKLHVRVLELERAGKKTTTLQMATIYIVFGGIFLNGWVTLSLQGMVAVANLSLVAAGLFLIMSIASMRQVKELDKLDNIR